MFKLEIETGNAAFGDSEFGANRAADVAPELARILREMADKFESGQIWQGNASIRDSNGNRVGCWRLMFSESE